MFRIRFNLLGGCFACNCSAAVFNRSCRIGSGIHFRAVGLLTPKSRAHFDTLPPGCSLYQASTLACCVGAPSRLICGLSVVNLAIVLTSCLLFFSLYHAAALLSSCFPVIFHVKKLKITENTPRRRSGWYISTAERGKTSLSRVSLDYCRRLSQTAKKTPAGNPWGHFVGQVSCVRRESVAVNGQEQNGLIAQTL